MIKLGDDESSGFLNDILNDNEEIDVLKTENRMLVAVKISAALKKRNISMNKFAEMIGQSTAVISDWLSGDINFSIDTLTEIGNALGINLINTEIE